MVRLLSRFRRPPADVRILVAPRTMRNPTGDVRPVPEPSSQLADPDASNDARSSATLRTSAFLFAIIILVIGGDLASDWAHGTSVLHLGGELVAVLIAAAGVAYLWLRMSQLRREARDLNVRLERATADAARWRAETATILRGLGEAVAAQLDRWALTPAEQEVALLLIKGLSHKEVAQVRGTSERTVRQQALAIYKKAGVSGRAELSAFFLEDLLLPMQRSEGRAM